MANVWVPHAFLSFLKNGDERYINEGPSFSKKAECQGGGMEVDRLRAGLILLGLSFVLFVAYAVLRESSVGPISDVLGIAFIFNFIGVLVVLGHFMNWYTEEGT
jgi:hypothetical protein